MANFVKLFSSILESTIWDEDLPTRVVWITMLCKADVDGNVYASVPGFARAANVTREQVEAALQKLLAEDPDSSSLENDGRRIEVINGGFKVLNYKKYRDRVSEEYQREKDRIRKRIERNGTKADTSEVA
jgi:hypothetical protein